MTRDEITRLAREAGFLEMGGHHGALRRFALLVQTREREACAKACEVMDHDEPRIGAACADAIRARKDE